MESNARCEVCHRGMSSERSPSPGDIFVLYDDAGRWSRAFEFVRFDEKDPAHMIVRERSTGELFNAPPGLLRCPAIGTVDEGSDTPAVEVPGGPGQPDLITDAQRRMLFARAKVLGLGLDDIRAMTPKGSVSALTKEEARDLIDRLVRRPGRAWQDQGAATGNQLATIEYLRGLVGFSDTEFGHWLGKWFKVESLARITDKALASRIIGGLSRMRANRIAGPADGNGGHKPRHSRAGVAG